jgi:HD-GYP domain-containing protein (c-di-GMP phosphodiesterase class II)
MPAARISLSEVLAALSHALDLTQGQPAGHAMRTCVIGCRIAEELGLPIADRSALYYALLLKDTGCSSNAARFSALFGVADFEAKGAMKRVDLHSRLRTALRTALTVGRGKPLAERARLVAGLAREPDAAREMIAIRCERGAEIVRMMGFPDATADAIRALDEHWCGRGYPLGLRGEEIPLLARVAILAQTVEIFYTHEGPRAALDVARRRRGTWFDPRLVDLVLGWRRDRAWWDALRAPDVAAMVAALEPAEHARRVDDTGLDVVARAFADIIDAKSPYTFRHSSHVAEYARGIALACGLGDAEARRLHRAGMLHDIGKLGVSSEILDAPRRLTDDERLAVEEHPLYTWEILRRVSAFEPFAWLAATHHEKLDGSGYPWRLGADRLDLSARVLVVADIYEALTADRPYRAGMPHAAALDLLWRDRGTKLCPVALDGLAAWAEGGSVAAVA